MVAIETSKSSLKERLLFPFREPEQWWEIWHQTERSLAAQFAMMPVNGISRRLLEDPSVTRQQSAAGKNKKAFEIAAFEYLENVFTRTTGAQIVRSWTQLYHHNQQFRTCVHAGELLGGLTATAAHYDQTPLPLAEELKNGKASPLHHLVFHSHDANELLSQFITGELEPTPTHLSELEQHLEALAELAQQPLAMAEGLRGMSTGPVTVHTRPSDYIRETLQLAQIENPRQLQILFSLLPPLITHGALSLSHVEYVPQEKRFFSAKQSIALAQAVESMLTKHEYEYNHDPSGKALVEGLSPSALVKKTTHGYAPLSEEELLGFGTLLLKQTKYIAGKDIDRVLAYADSHYEAIEAQLLDSVYPKPTEDMAATLNRQTALSSTVGNTAAATLTSGWQAQSPAPHSLKTDRIGGYLGKVWDNVTRSESVHEMNKLYRRKLPIQMTKMPINIIGDYLLRGDSKDVKDIRGGKWAPILKKELWGLASNPVAGSHGLVAVKEVVSAGTQLTDQSIRTLTRHFNAAVESGLQQDDAIRESLWQARQTIHDRELTVPAALEMKIRIIQQKAPTDYQPEDYQTLHQYFQSLAQQVNRQSEQVLSPYRATKDEPLTGIIARNTLQPAQDLPSALVALSFVSSVLTKEVRNLHSLEFVDPEKNLLDVKSFRRIADTMEAQLTNAGLAVIGESYHGKPLTPDYGNFKPGDLVQFNTQSNRYEAAPAESIIRLANVVTATFREELGANISRITQGDYTKTHCAAVETALFSDKHKAKQQQADTASLKPKATLSGATPWAARSGSPSGNSRGMLGTLSNAWSHATRPEAMHEAKLLFDRTVYARVTGIPIGMWQNFRRGYLPVDKETGYWKVNSNASASELLTNPGKFISRGSLLSQLWGAVGYPVGEFISTIGREFFRYEVKDTLDDSKKAGDALHQAIQHGKGLTPNWEAETLATTGRSAALESLCQQETMRLIPTIAAKPAHLRREDETRLMEAFMEKTGHLVLTSAATLLHNATPHEGGTSRAASISPAAKTTDLLAKPAENLVEANLALGLIQEVISTSRSHLGVLRYVDPESMLIDRKALAELSGFIQTQFDAAKASGELDTDKGFIRLANVLRDHFITSVDMDKFNKQLQSNPQRYDGCHKAIAL